jgi:hypothetical protein
LIPGNKCNPQTGLNLLPKRIACPDVDHGIFGHGGLSGGMIAFIVVLVVAVVGGGGFAWFYFKRRQQQ